MQKKKHNSLKARKAPDSKKDPNSKLLSSAHASQFCTLQYPHSRVAKKVGYILKGIAVF
jgi:hypothetical protein